jgi:hypothetical protein
MHSEDWAKLWGPLAKELVVALIGVIFGKAATKNQIYKQYMGGKTIYGRKDDGEDY